MSFMSLTYVQRTAKSPNNDATVSTFFSKKRFELSKGRVTLEYEFVPSVLELGDETGRDPDLKIRPPAQSAYSPSGTPSSVRSWTGFIATQ